MRGHSFSRWVFSGSLHTRPYRILRVRRVRTFILGGVQRKVAIRIDRQSHSLHSSGCDTELLSRSDFQVQDSCVRRASYPRPLRTGMRSNRHWLGSGTIRHASWRPFDDVRVPDCPIPCPRFRHHPADSPMVMRTGVVQSEEASRRHYHLLHISEVKYQDDAGKLVQRGPSACCCTLENPSHPRLNSCPRATRLHATKIATPFSPSRG
jgi:hypothetical protein